MIRYRLTKKGKIAVVTFCTFIIFCFCIGIFFSNKDDPNDYSAPIIEDQQLVTKPEPPPISVEEEEPLEKIKLSIYFEANMITYDTKQNDALNIFSEAALKYKDSQIQIEGNCATLFPSSKNQKPINYNLSKQRALAIASYLKSRGINGERLIIVANGSDKPLQDNSSPKGLKFNRRVDVFFINK
ncbi:MAG: cell envelope biosis protein OmpA [Clostridia bacterium]|jgi:outer membrane protein OmpA-like peptidoglycan-associated protein|nr:cell envelope biosis protein OmpA [Clostridia bacterium]